MTGRHISIRGKPIPYDERELPFRKLAFYAENPRVHSQFGDDEVRTQQAIFERMTKMDYVKKLRRDIDRDGQVNEPLYVVQLDSDDPLTPEHSHLALEGNSRLAALKLNKPGTLPKPEVLCWILNFSAFGETERESLIFSLLGQLHIKGKKDWGAYEDAGFFYRRHRHHNTSMDAVALEAGVSVGRVRKAIRAYALMTSHDDRKQSRFSYYEVYVAMPKLSKWQEKYPDIDQTVVSYIKDGKFGEAQRMRKYLPGILEHKPARKVFFDSGVEDPFEDAVATLQAGGRDDPVFKWLRSFRMKLALSDTKRSVERLLRENSKVAKDTDFELKKISSITASLRPES